MSKKTNFDDLYQEIETAIEKLEQGDQPMQDNIALYKEAVQKVEQAMKMLELAENEIKEISSKINFEEDKQ